MKCVILIFTTFFLSQVAYPLNVPGDISQNQPDYSTEGPTPLKTNFAVVHSKDGNNYKPQCVIQPEDISSVTPNALAALSDSDAIRSPLPSCRQDQDLFTELSSIQGNPIAMDEGVDVAALPGILFLGALCVFGASLEISIDSIAPVNQTGRDFLKQFNLLSFLALGPGLSSLINGISLFSHQAIAPAFIGAAKVSYPAAACFVGSHIITYFLYDHRAMTTLEYLANDVEYFCRGHFSNESRRKRKCQKVLSNLTEFLETQ